MMIGFVISFALIFRGANDVQTGLVVDTLDTPIFRGLGDGGEVLNGAITVDIFGDLFLKQVIKVKKGSTVIWLNKDLDAHQIIEKDNLFESPVLNRGSSFAMDFDDVGVYDYYDKLDYSIVGRVIVVE